MMVTRVVLLGTLAITSVALAEVLRRGELEAPTTAAFLLVLTALFVIRVAGQVLVVRRAPAWLPPMRQWNLVPYRILFPIQLAFVAVMAAIVASLFSGDGPLAEPVPAFGRFLIGFSLVYAGSMLIRYAIRMRRRPEERWLGGAIPIVFHVVLAAFLFTWGVFHVSG
jgi:hypothetical protein